MWRLILLSSSLISSVAAFSPDYFPLQVGNQWIYKPSRGGQTLSVEVAGTDSAGDASYSVVRGFPGGDVWLRMSDSGTLYAYNPATKEETIWANFGAAEGEAYAAGIDACSPTAQIRSRASHAVIPIGEFNNLLAIEYPPARCADAGLNSELYLPYVGLVRRVETTIAGALTYDLVYARLGGVVVVNAPEQSFSVAVSPDLLVRISLRNNADPITLTFPTAQRFDIVARNAKGDVAYQWSSGRAFAQLFGEVKVTGELSFVAQIPPGTLPAGRYTVEAWLATSPVTYRAQMAVEIK